MMTSAEGEYIAPVSTDSSSTASGKEKEEPVEDDDLYCIDGAFVFFQVLSCTEKVRVWEGFQYPLLGFGRP